MSVARCGEQFESTSKALLPVAFDVLQPVETYYIGNRSQISTPTQCLDDS